MADGKILSYNDVVLRESDLDILSGPNFLNDRIIEFYFSYLSSCYPSDESLLTPPAISFWITNCTDEQTLKAFIEPLSLPSKNLVIFAVNDNEDVTCAEGGSHWSLLAFERKHNVFVHHDSLGGINRHYAKRLYRSVHGFMACSEPAEYVEYDASPRQLNGYDCGLFVTAIARIICSWYVNAESKNRGDLWFFDLKEQVMPLAVEEMRWEILGLIKQLIASK
ncbi:hypothetical protein V2J09_009371 [Rumex salicifolius]